ncbi:MAG: aminotransferase class I/II-fold pyridoxal phosphate-dependent enzyme [Microcella sp.]|uniref:DegT/DnrJ/EryC1/StrS family aminotransferase n=1 Tax=Microcella sp. TaxID=1913979 RepID=UPI0024C89A94|nr:DegT/DnrJ/EryC1/StrS family aminotransferase [Microcella sp.]UYN82565.1 MAG: aminotransferase class I/II-fold pyridoxal phosphate-dependent enzyme [Microcella sp.]
MPEPDAPAFPEPLHVGRPNIGSLERFNALVAEAFERRWLSNDGPLVREFEERIAHRIGARHCIAVTNGTIALEIAVRALELKGEVIVPSWTFVATVHALQWLGLTPVFADIDVDTQCLDPESVRSKITPRTTGILAVHLWGRAAPVRELEAIAAEHSLTLLFDAAHAFGVSAEGRMVGNYGNAEVFSFHATKFFNTLEGGAVVTNDDELAARLRLMRNFGFSGEDNVVSVGTNGKMNEICAAMGITNLERLDEVIDVNRANYERYAAGIASIPGVTLLPIDEEEESNYQYVVVLVDRVAGPGRNEVLDELRRNNVLARRYFWPAAHRMEPYRSLTPNISSSLPNTETVAEQVIVLPTGTAVDLHDIDKVVEVIRRTVATK